MKQEEGNFAVGYVVIPQNAFVSLGLFNGVFCGVVILSV